MTLFPSREFCRFAPYTDPAHVSFEDVIAYREFLKGQGKSACTIALHMSAMRSLFKHLYEEGLIKGNVFVKCKLPKVPKESKAEFLNKEQALELLSAPDVTTIVGLRDYIVLSLLLMNVLRRGAIGSIQRKGFRREGKHYILWYINKGGESIKTKVSPALAGVLKEYIFLLQENGIDPDEDDPLFFSFKPKSFGTALTGSGVYKLVKKHAERVGLDIHPHVLRHSGITMALMGGASLGKVQKLAAITAQTVLRYDRSKWSLEDHGTDYIGKFLEG